jgi:hypothetical protein
MVGGSTWGMLYDVAVLAELAARPGRRRPSVGATDLHLDRIVENNAGIYRVIREQFCESGRYHRTMGNHDDVFDDPSATQRLASHLPGTRVVDTILLSGDGAGPAEGIAGVDAVVAHGHLTDSWNGPGFALLGRLITWMATSLDDLPRRPGANRFEGLPDEQAVRSLLNGTARNRLVTLDPRFGGNRRFDSLDEERLFAALHDLEPQGGWPWLIHGHTHYPMLRPLDSAGRPVRYANSGSGVLDRAFSALEWDGSRPEDPLRLVLWTELNGDGPERIELASDGPGLRAA